MKWQLDNFTDKDIVLLDAARKIGKRVETFLKKHAKVKILSNG